MSSKRSSGQSAKKTIKYGRRNTNHGNAARKKENISPHLHTALQGKENEMKKEIETIKKELTELEHETESRIKNIRAELGKLKQPDVPKGFTGDVVCTESHLRFTEDKIYHFKDGYVADDDGYFNPTYQYTSISDWNDHHLTTFRPAVESDYAEPEPVRLWCAKDYKPGIWVTRGNVYEVKGKRAVSFDNGWCDKSFYPMMLECGFIDDNETRWDKHLFLLEKRLAKVGEWARVTSKVDPFHCPDRKEGDIFKITGVDRGLVISHENRFNQNEYEVIVDYNGEYENVCPNCGDRSDRITRTARTGRIPDSPTRAKGKGTLKRSKRTLL